MKAKFVNEAIRHLTPRSEEEIKDLEKRGFRNDGSKWRFTIDIEDITEDYNENEDAEEYKKSIIQRLQSKVDDIQIHAGEDEALNFENIIEEFQMLDENPEPDEVDYVLNMLYDWADDNNVWIKSF